MIDSWAMQVLYFLTWFKLGNELNMDPKPKKLRYQTLFEKFPSGRGGSTKKNFPNKKNDKNEKDVHAIAAPASHYQQTYTLPAMIYQLMTLPPPAPAYCNMNPPPSLYHPQQEQYRPNRSNNLHYQNRQQGNPQRSHQFFRRQNRPTATLFLTNLPF